MFRTVTNPLKNFVVQTTKTLFPTQKSSSKNMQLICTLSLENRASKRLVRTLRTIHFVVVQFPASLEMLSLRFVPHTWLNLMVQSSRFMVQSSGLTFQGLEFMVHGSWFTVHSSGFMVHGSRFRVQCLGFMVHCSRFTVHDYGFRVQGWGFMVHNSGLGFTVHSSGFTVHGLKFRAHSSRLKVQGL